MLISCFMDFVCSVRLHGAAIFGGNLKVDDCHEEFMEGLCLFFFSVFFCGVKRVTSLLYAITKSGRLSISSSVLTVMCSRYAKI